MCRLVLMNRETTTVLGSSLDYFFGYLQSTLGGDGNGVAALWQESHRVRVKKGVALTAQQAAQRVLQYAEEGADWMLFHTRRATSSAVANQHCHPFRCGQLVVAHNGHDGHFARLGRFMHLSDSECITRAWSQVRFPLPALSTCSGVFLGFAADHPFVVKGQPHSDLVAGWHQGTGAILFASDVPSWLSEGVFDRVVRVKTIQWFGRDLDTNLLDVGPYHPRLSPSSSAYYHSPGAYGYGYDDEEEFEGVAGRWPDELEEEEAAMEEEEETYDEVTEEEDWRHGKQIPTNYSPNLLVR